MPLIVPQKSIPCTHCFLFRTILVLTLAVVLLHNTTALSFRLHLKIPSSLGRSHLRRTPGIAMMKQVSPTTSHASPVESPVGSSNTFSLADAVWVDLKVPPAELRPEFTLIMGQCFNWRQVVASTSSKPDSEGCWLAALGKRVVAIRQRAGTTEAACLLGGGLLEEEEAAAAGRPPFSLAAALGEYFQLGTPLAPLYARWSAADPRLAAVAAALPGVRVLRITQMLQKLRTNYGTYLGSVVCDGGEEIEVLDFHSFPTLQQLSRATEKELRDFGFGYRAKYIVQTVEFLKNQPDDWLVSLRELERQEAQQALTQLAGVGPKVADCIALFCADQISSIPVDTHVWRIACRDYDQTLQDCKSLTPGVYERVGDEFRRRFGPHAGWAHSLLFAAEIPNFKHLLPLNIVEEMEAFKKYEKEQKELNKKGKLKEKAKRVDAVTKETKPQRKKKRASDIRQTKTTPKSSGTALKKIKSEETEPPQTSFSSLGKSSTRQTKKRLVSSMPSFGDLDSPVPTTKPRSTKTKQEKDEITAIVKKNNLATPSICQHITTATPTETSDPSEVSAALKMTKTRGKGSSTNIIDSGSTGSHSRFIARTRRQSRALKERPAAQQQKKTVGRNRKESGDKEQKKRRKRHINFDAGTPFM